MKAATAEARKKQKVGNTLWGIAIAVIGLFPLIAILIGNLITYASIVKNPESIFNLINTWGNFPTGIFTAVFVPDTFVFLNQMSWGEWYLITAGSLLTFYALFAISNFNLDSKARTERLVEFICLIFLLSFIGNILGLYLYGQTAGPSGAIYSLEGLLYGFTVSNVIIVMKNWGHSLRIFLREPQNFPSFAISLSIAFIFPIYAISNPVGFFSLAMNGVKVAGDVHIFCFLVGAVVAGAIGILRGSRAFPPLAVSEVTSVKQSIGMGQEI